MRGVLDIPDELRPVGEMLGGALVRVENQFDEALSADLEPVAALCRHVEAYRGKMLRPTLAILCGCAASNSGSGPGGMATALGGYANGQDGEQRAGSPQGEGIATPSRGHATPGVPDADALPETLIAIAGVVEMVHMATLVHDDVLDEADTRRRGATVNSLHGNESAVILGDYLIAAAYHWCATLDDPHYARRIGRVSMDVCSGELLQLSRRRDFALSEATYFEIVSRKTGALVAVACELGARAMGAGPGVQEAMFGFGRDLGVAFQIQDDLLDLTGDEATVGKSVRKDLEKGKLTLPLIHHLATAEPERRRTTLGYLEAATRTGHEDAAGDADLMAALDQTGSVRYAEATAERLVDQARGVLRGLPESAVVAMLGTMADAVVHRAF